MRLLKIFPLEDSLRMKLINGELKMYANCASICYTERDKNGNEMEMDHQGNPIPGELNMAFHNHLNYSVIPRMKCWLGQSDYAVTGTDNKDNTSVYQLVIERRDGGEFCQQDREKVNALMKSISEALNKEVCSKHAGRLFKQEYQQAAPAQNDQPKQRYNLRNHH